LRHSVVAVLLTFVRLTLELPRMVVATPLQLSLDNSKQGYDIKKI